MIDYNIYEGMCVCSRFITVVFSYIHIMQHSNDGRGMVMSTSFSRSNMTNYCYRELRKSVVNIVQHNYTRAPRKLGPKFVNYSCEYCDCSVYVISTIFSETPM